MTWHDAETDHRRVIATDTSVLVNLLATRAADRILSSVDADWIYTASVHRELTEPLAYAKTNGTALHELADAGLLRMAKLNEKAQREAVSLMSGTAAASVGEGEAATIAYAGGRADVEAVVDDSKALRIGRSRFPQVRFSTTIDILREPAIEAALGREGLADAVERALLDARAAVTGEDFPWVLELVGRTRLMRCSSLARHFRGSNRGS